MLSLHSTTDAAWLASVADHLDELLIDHAHCEKKAAGVAMNLIFVYVDRVPLALALSAIVEEELDHFRQVLAILERRSIKFRRIKPSNYAGQLNELVRRGEPEHAVDRLLVAGLIEARSCERFAVLKNGIDDVELATFYASLFESEARHHSTYVELARLFAPAATVHARLHELSAAEAEIIARGDTIPRMHS